MIPETREAQPNGVPEQSDVLVLFGASGDLAKKKLFPALYHLTEAGKLRIPVVGVAFSDWTSRDLAQYAADAVHAAVPDVDDAVLQQMTDRLSMATTGRRRRSAHWPSGWSPSGSASRPTTWPSRRVFSAPGSRGWPPSS